MFFVDPTSDLTDNGLLISNVHSTSELLTSNCHCCWPATFIQLEDYWPAIRSSLLTSNIHSTSELLTSNPVVVADQQRSFNFRIADQQSGRRCWPATCIQLQNCWPAIRSSLLTSNVHSTSELLTKIKLMKRSLRKRTPKQCTWIGWAASRPWLSWQDRTDFPPFLLEIFDVNCILIYDFDLLWSKSVRLINHDCLWSVSGRCRVPFSASGSKFWARLWHAKIDFCMSISRPEFCIAGKPGWPWPRIYSRFICCQTTFQKHGSMNSNFHYHHLNLSNRIVSVAVWGSARQNNVHPAVQYVCRRWIAIHGQGHFPQGVLGHVWQFTFDAHTESWRSWRRDGLGGRRILSWTKFNCVSFFELFLIFRPKSIGKTKMPNYKIH